MPKFKELIVKEISLVDKPANRKSCLYKSADGLSAKFELMARVVKSDESKGLLYITVYEPNVRDTQGDWADPELIEKAAHRFMIERRVDQIDVQHSHQTDAGSLVESFIKNGDDDRFPDTANGSWVGAIKVADKYKSHLDEIGGASLYGEGSYHESVEHSASDLAEAEAPVRRVPLMRVAQPLARVVD